MKSNEFFMEQNATSYIRVDFFIVKYEYPGYETYSCYDFPLINLKTAQ